MATKELWPIAGHVSARWQNGNSGRRSTLRPKCQLSCRCSVGNDLPGLGNEPFRGPLNGKATSWMVCKGNYNSHLPASLAPARGPFPYWSLQFPSVPPCCAPATQAAPRHLSATSFHKVRIWSPLLSSEPKVCESGSHFI